MRRRIVADVTAFVRRASFGVVRINQPSGQGIGLNWWA
jgi:hypothetical protein